MDIPNGATDSLRAAGGAACDRAGQHTPPAVCSWPGLCVAWGCLVDNAAFVAAKVVCHADVKPKRPLAILSCG
jgi:hypothetical protein